MSKKIIFAHAEKGGVGKSQTLIWLSEYLRAIDIDHGIVEADTIRDVGARYSADYAPLQIAGDIDSAGIARLFDAIEAQNQSIVLVNLPAASNTILERDADDFFTALESTEASARVLYVADDQAHSEEFFIRSRDRGFLKYPDKTAIVRNLHFGPYTDIWPISRITDTPIFDLPALDRNLMELIKKTQSPICDIVPKLGKFEAVKVNKWIKQAGPVTEYILGD